MHCFGEPCAVGSLALPVPGAPWAAREALIAAPGDCWSQPLSFPGILGRRLGLVEVCALTKAGMQVEQGRRGALQYYRAPAPSAGHPSVLPSPCARCCCWEGCTHALFLLLARESHYSFTHWLEAPVG